jgi:NAD kinase
MAPFDVPLIGINQGRLGFLTIFRWANGGHARRDARRPLHRTAPHTAPVVVERADGGAKYSRSTMAVVSRGSGSAA